MKKALHELLELIAENPSLADRITITMKPSKIEQSEDPEDKPKET